MEQLLMGVAGLAFCIIIILIEKKRRSRSADKFTEVFSKFPGEEKVDTILTDNFFANKTQNLKKLNNSAAKIILLNRDHVFVITDLVCYQLLPAPNRGPHFSYKELLRDHRRLYDKFEAKADRFACGQVYLSDCYISHDIVNRFGKPTFETTYRDGFLYVSVTNKSSDQVQGIVNYIKQVTQALCQKASSSTFTQTIQEQEQLRARQQQLWADGAWELPVDVFLQSCKENNIGDISSERDIQKAKLIVETLMRQDGVPQEYQAQYITYEKLTKYFSQIWQINEDIAQAELQKQISQLRLEEKAFAEECTRYANLVGRDKSIRYCQDKIAYYSNIIWQCEENEKSVRNGGNVLYETSKGREKSWAVHGGIANGIAGGAAGVAVAMDVERRNEQVRRQNANLAESIAHLSAMALETIWKTKREAKENLNFWQSNEEKAKLILTQSLDENDLLAQLSPKVASIENSPTGAVKLKIELKATTDLTIYENVSAVVDGCIRVKLSTNNENVGNTLCTVKYNGATAKHFVNCICIDVSKQAEAYDVSFEPYHLWAVEKHL